ELLDTALARPVEELRDLEIVGPHAVHRGDRPVEHVVHAFELAGALDGEDIERLLDHAYDLALPLVGRADRARVRLRDVEADRAIAEIGLHRAHRGGERLRVPRRRAEDVIGEALRRLGSDARELAELVDESRERTRERLG